MAVSHHDEIVGKPCHLVGRVRHIENRHPQFISELFKPGENLALSREIECRKGLVHKENVGPEAKRSRDGAALPFAPGEFGYAALQKMPDA